MPTTSPLKAGRCGLRAGCGSNTAAGGSSGAPAWTGKRADGTEGQPAQTGARLERGRAVKGFDPTFRDFPDYLMTVSRALWEERRFAERLGDYIHPQLIHRAGDGIVFGPSAMAASALELLVGVPDLRLPSEDVIWCGSDAHGFLGSQRIMAQGTHSGAGLYGPATGRRLRFRILSDAYAKDNRISDVWQVTDSGAILRRLGRSPEAWALERLRTIDPETQPFSPRVDSPGPYTGSGTSETWGNAFGDLLEQVMQGAFSAIPEQYDRACQLSYPGGVEAHGPDAADAFWLGLRAAFPSADFTIRHRIGMEEPLLPPRAAIRWSLQGRHEGFGPFGPPSGAEVHVMGISHAEFGPRGLRREWTLFDEAAIWMQIVLGRG